MSERITTSATQHTQKEVSRYVVNHAYEEGYACALWRLPNETSSNVLLSFSPRRVSKDQALEEMVAGFMFAPFDVNAERYFLNADVMLVYSDGKLQANQCSPTSLEWLANAQDQVNECTKISNYHLGTDRKPKSIEQKEFCSIVETAIHRIESGDFEKVVPSRVKRIALPGGFDAVEAFTKLCDCYPDAMISLVSIPAVGTWIGATPELLVEVTNQSTFKTIALAGTRPKVDGIDPREVAWTQKEIEEQALVSRYIINCFKKIRLREFDEHGPKTIVAGNLMHLRTEYSVDMVATNFPQLGSVMLDLLHPTSAVCGMPMGPTLEFIHEHESHDRSFYSGFIGPVNINQATHLFVNLRCMHLLGDQATCYAGAGVTVDSIPEKEWEETEMKLNTLLSVIT
jgi:isochorismate synthase